MTLKILKQRKYICYGSGAGVGGISKVVAWLRESIRAQSVSWRRQNLLTLPSGQNWYLQTEPLSRDQSQHSAVVQIWFLFQAYGDL